MHPRSYLIKICRGKSTTFGLCTGRRVPSNVLTEPLSLPHFPAAQSNHQFNMDNITIPNIKEDTVVQCCMVQQSLSGICRASPAVQPPHEEHPVYRNALGVLSKALDKVQRDGLQGSMADAEVSTDNTSYKRRIQVQQIQSRSGRSHDNNSFSCKAGQCSEGNAALFCRFQER